MDTFKSKTEAYTHTISKLMGLRDKLLRERKLDQASHKKYNQNIRRLKKLFENHEQDPEVFAKAIHRFNRIKAVQKYEPFINKLIEKIRSSTYEQTLEEKFENLLARRFESELAIELLTNPTHAMMQAVSMVSDRILVHMDDLLEEGIDSSIFFKPGRTSLSFGGFTKQPTLDDVKTLLIENSPQKLPQIMFVHYMYADGPARRFPIKHPVVREPVGVFAELIKQRYPENHEEFFTKGISSAENEADRRYIGNTVMYDGELYSRYREQGDRGRLGTHDFNLTTQMGLLLKTQLAFSARLPHLKPAWHADCVNQLADLSSPYVLDLIENDGVYVSGPSGILSFMINQMEILANLPDENFKKHYLTAIAAYIVSGGYHSFHEVLAPAQYYLNLIPGYAVKVPEEGTLGPPPNYHQFFSQQKKIDPEFQRCVSKTWHAYMRFYENIYYPFHIVEDEAYLEHLLDMIERPETPEQDVERSEFFSEDEIQFAELLDATKEVILSKLEFFESDLLELADSESTHTGEGRLFFDTVQNTRILVKFSPSFEEIEEAIKISSSRLQSLVPEAYENKLNDLFDELNHFIEDQKAKQPSGSGLRPS